jgi:hypothetical protein
MIVSGNTDYNTLRYSLPAHQDGEW